MVRKRRSHLDNGEGRISWKLEQARSCHSSELLGCLNLRDYGGLFVCFDFLRGRVVTSGFLFED